MYKILCALRVALVFVPQIGYIHPDEHFQSPEIVYGDILNLATHRTWEFNNDFPIRNIVFPYSVVGIPALIAKLFKIEYLHGSVLYSYLLMVLPRFVFCCLSFLHEFFIYKICKIMKINYKISLYIFASSYVSLIYLTRTFSNSLEALFFTFILYIVSNFNSNKNGLKRKKIMINPRSCHLCFMMGIVCAVGFFNRPTFVAFAAFPVALFCSYISFNKCNLIIKIHYFLSLFLGLISMSLVLVAIDTLYYKQMHYSDIYRLLYNVTVTPWNFCLYNVKADNLSNHGLHPFWLHLCINTPLLFSYYGVLAIFQFCKHIHRFKSSYMIFLPSFVVPLLVLSMVPHQEPRFIVPLVIPLVFICGTHFGQKQKQGFSVGKLWYMHNFACLIFYGFLHQGGIYLSLSSIHTMLPQDSSSTSVIYYKTYMPPQYLLGIEKHSTHFRLYDFAGVEMEAFEHKTKNVTTDFKPQNLFIVVPNDVYEHISLSSGFLSEYNLKEIKSFFPHLSIENLPSLRSLIDVLHLKCTLSEKLEKWKMMFSIQVLTFRINRGIHF